MGEHHVLLKMSLPCSPAPAQGHCRHNNSGSGAAIPETTMLLPSPGAATESGLLLYISELKSAPFSFWKKNLQKQRISTLESALKTGDAHGKLRSACKMKPHGIWKHRTSVFSNWKPNYVFLFSKKKKNCILIARQNKTWILKSTETCFTQLSLFFFFSVSVSQRKIFMSFLFSIYFRERFNVSWC